DLTQPRLAARIGRPVIWRPEDDGDTRVGIVGKIEDGRAALVSITAGGRSTHYCDPESLAWIGAAAFRRGMPRLAPPLTLERLLAWASPAALATRVADREATIEIYLLARDPGMQPQLGVADVLRLLAIPARTSFSDFDSATSKLGRALRHEMEARELSWDSQLYPIVARGFVESFEAVAPARPREVDLDLLDREQLIEFLAQRRWPAWTVRVVVSDPAWLEHLEHAGPWAIDFEDLEPAS